MSCFRRRPQCCAACCRGAPLPTACSPTSIVTACRPSRRGGCMLCTLCMLCSAHGLSPLSGTPKPAPTLAKRTYQQVWNVNRCSAVVAAFNTQVCRGGGRRRGGRRRRRQPANDAGTCAPAPAAAAPQGAAWSMPRRGFAFHDTDPPAVTAHVGPADVPLGMLPSCGGSAGGRCVAYVDGSKARREGRRGGQPLCVPLLAPPHLHSTPAAQSHPSTATHTRL